MKYALFACIAIISAVGGANASQEDQPKGPAQGKEEPTKPANPDQSAKGNGKAAPAEGNGTQGDSIRTIGPIQDAELRTFAGPCLVTPRGGDQQAALVGSLAGLIPAFVGAGIDLLTAALEEAGKDQITTVQTTLALEHRPYCIQVARMGLPTTAQLMDPQRTPAQRGQWLQDSLKQAPFVVEFYLRQSRDGSAIAVMPTVIRYNQSITGKEISRTPRELFATLTFSTIGSPDGAKVSVPLGSYAPQPNATPHYFDPVVFPTDPTLPTPTGAAASQWIKSPYAAPAQMSQTEAQIGVDTAGNGQRSTGGGSGFSNDDAPPPPATTGQPRSRRGNNKASAQGSTQPPLAAKPILYGDRTAPYSILVELRETKRGSTFARILASLLKSGKGTVVDAVDPAKQAAAKKQDLETWKTGQTAYATALSDYYKKRAAYCKEPGEITAADLLESQVKLAASAKAAGDAAVPFTDFIDPIHPAFACT